MKGAASDPTDGSSDKDRLDPFGSKLRSTSLDELPELWNVLRGDMSLVGPRPLLMHYLPLYTERQARRHEVRPGVTGWAQINGRNAIPWPQRLEMDVWYVENRSFLLDLKILALTIPRALQRSGVSQEGQTTVEYFTGTQT
jgi:sugar transferase EpsL